MVTNFEKNCQKKSTESLWLHTLMINTSVTVTSDSISTFIKPSFGQLRVKIRTNSFFDVNVW